MSDTVNVNESNFEETVLKSSVPVLVDFWAAWCGPCRTIAPSLEELATEYKGKALIVKMDVSDNEHTPANYGVRSIPHLSLFKKGEVVETINGAHPKDKIAALLDRHLA